MKNRTMTICLIFWICYSGLLLAEENKAAAQSQAPDTKVQEKSQPAELSIDPEDELLWILEQERKQQQLAKKQLAAKVEITEAIETKPAVLVVSDPNEIKETALDNQTKQEKQEFHDLRKKIMYDQMQPVDELTEEEKNNNLDKLIQQLRSLETPKKITPEKEEPAEAPEEEKPAPVIEPVPVVEEKPVPVVVEEKEDMLLKLLANAQNVREPLRLADVLFREQYYEQAYKYYQMTLETTSTEDVSNYQWILFQMGNCARQFDPAKAIEIYTELISSYPNAKWSHIAMARRSIIQWTQDNKVNELIDGGQQ